jgi:hypothetical protein
VSRPPAGLSRSQYLAARDGLVRRGLVVVEHAGDGRGNSPVVAVRFAQAGPWFDGEVNARLFEAASSWSRARGSARLLLAALAALADEQLAVSLLSTEELRAAAGMADSTYRRARAALLASGEVALEAAGGGRAKTNRWVLRDPRSGNPEPVLAPLGRVAPSRSARPLLATVTEPDAADRSEPAAVVNGPGSSGVSVRSPAQCRTVSRQTPPETPPQTPPPYVRAGREPQNLRSFPPNPPDGGSRTESVTIVEDYLTDRGRTRQRTAVVALDAIREQLRSASDTDLADWERIRSELRVLVGESTFEIWLAQLELAATDPGGRLLLAAPPSTRSWVAHRFARAFDHASVAVDRSVRLADERELRLLEALATSPSPAAAPAADALPHLPHPIPHKEAV